ncbi:TIGR03986 family CRISPR-associated RAMP protein [Candidatus Micrarchaeota archaeon]|jgi:CRISPR-associated protein (TIGR03986 family)|nr:TIGR03986 family CRISPR-associated RAMP protein [Candidatus Micrarchaeota archaeon]
MNPRHNNPTPTLKGRVALAPYNFVPLPEQIVRVDYKIPEHNNYTENTGYLDCTLTTQTPTYTRSALDPDFFARWGDDIQEIMKDDQARKIYAQFLHLDDAQRPIIFGSSLRGMTRALIEIVGYGKVQWVTKRHLFFRTVDDTAVGKYYRNRMIEKIEGGFLRKSGEQYYIKKSQVARIHRNDLGNNAKIYEGKAPNLTPHWDGKTSQYAHVWVKISDSDGKFVKQIKYEKTKGLQEGRLIITGDVPGKKKEFVFLLTEPSAEEIDVPYDLIERFHDDDQISQWQERAFPKDKPDKDCRQKNGLLRDDSFLSREGDPVFFIREDEKLTFFGRAQMFRLPYHHSPFDLIPKDLHPNACEKGTESIDIAEAIFGFAATGKETKGRAGRVFFTDAICDLNQEKVWLPEGVITPKILSSPKPTTSQHYLVQDKEKGHNPDIKSQLAHYGTPTPEETVIRGHKFYWHKQEGLAANNFSDEDPDWLSDTQHTQIKPVAANIRFRFKVYFENLTNVELGALLWVLDLPGGYHHKIGMGKPLGLGSIAIESRLIMTNRQERYSKLLDDNGWHTGEDTKISEANFKKDFEYYILEHMDQEERGSAKEMCQLSRIQMLLKMLEWPGPGPNLTEYMTINQYKERPVLPDPLSVGLKKSDSSLPPKMSMGGMTKISKSYNSISADKSAGLVWLEDTAKKLKIDLDGLLKKRPNDLPKRWKAIQESKLKNDVLKEIVSQLKSNGIWNNPPTKKLGEMVQFFKNQIEGQDK